MTIQIKPVAGRIGAELSGVKLGGNVSEENFSVIHQALLKYKVLFFRDQHLDDAEHEAFSQRFGEQVPHPTLRSEANSTAILNLDAKETRANSWHTDVTFVANYPKISILRGVVIPPYGGDTVWANTAAAYADLPAPLNRLADNLRALHTNLYDYAAPHASALKRYREQFTADVYETEHPLVRVHPESGERSLLLGHFVKHIQGVSQNDSKQLLRLFHDRITHLDNTVRWRWQAGDVVIWDNRATQHVAINDYGDAQRIVRRTTIDGDVPVGVDGRPSTALKPSPDSRSPKTEADKKHLAA
ncbi:MULTISPECIES: TauD/TfdA dioxygenase family protein [Pseudomonadaceae]|jgi:taurine dioxygenase|uniref:TauD/TfdA dioxygenase family protein n=1 Tax=Pseudomonadaceae TaxID=135621 RepID=UPI000441B508|nr:MULTISPECIES: TauD/TfdA family dioxygenase [Pseudomonadaceae]MCI1037279.1 TauD/TfdA family dioxygenase [Pseudomonas putida]PNG82051.1 putative dioxygenase [Pseudomonas putida]UBT82249.1 TauD/TfdA family dioxygenase [Pseudomonas amygdali]